MSQNECINKEITMTQEEKARRYDEAIKRAKELLEIGVKDTRDKRVVLSFFPELKESEGERIRKEITELVMLPTWETETEFYRRKELVAWLEKQGEQKPTENKGMNLVEEEMTPFQKKVFCIIDTTIEEEQGLKQVCDELFALAFNDIEKKPAAWRGTRLTI